ncbi:MAG: fasciclin domain-containing protein [Bacteroidota bacterium]
MKRHIGLGWMVMVFLTGFLSCNDPELKAGFEDLLDLTIYDYIIENDSAYSSFLAILEKGGIDKTLSAYNPDGIGYTLFLPDNDAIDKFIQESDQYTSLQEILNDTEYTRALSRYHVVNMGIHTDEFPFGALPEYTLSGDILTVSFVIETDTSYYKINNQAHISKQNIEVSNGYVHIVEDALIPVTKTTYDFLEQHSGYSLFKAAVDATGFGEIMDINIRDEEVDSRPFTLLVEHDSVYNASEIYTFADLAAFISPDDNNYTDPTNPLYGYVAYHLLEESMFLADFVDVATNYTTYSEIPININGYGLDILINSGKEVFDTIIHGVDTTIIDYVGFYYDDSNVLTQSGAVHFIDRVLRQQRPSRAIQTFEFWEEPLLNEYRQVPGEYLIEDTASLYHVNWWGSDLFFIETGDDQHPAWGGDYLYMDGDFRITYHIPKIVQGVYTVYLRAETLNSNNALVEVFIDGKNVGGLVDLSQGGNPNNPFEMRELGTINLMKYEDHTVEIKSLIPGRFSWDLIRFEPYTKD